MTIEISTIQPCSMYHTVRAASIRRFTLRHFTSSLQLFKKPSSIIYFSCALFCAGLGTDSIKQHGEGEDITNHSGHNTIHNHSIWFLSKPQQNIISSEDCRGGQDVAWLCPRHASFHHWRLHLRLLHPRSASDVGAKRGWNIVEHQPTIMDW